MPGCYAIFGICALRPWILTEKQRRLQFNTIRGVFIGVGDTIRGVFIGVGGVDLVYTWHNKHSFHLSSDGIVFK